MARPNLSYLKNLVLTLAGVPCGVLTGLTGISNTYLSASLLHWLIGLRDRKLNGTVLVIAGFTALTAILAYGQHHLLHLVQAVVCGIGFLAGAAYATRIETADTPRHPIGGYVGTLLLLATGLLLVASGLNLAHPRQGVLGHGFGGQLGLIAYVALGVVLGFIGRVTEVWGLMIVPSLIYLAGLSIYHAQGIALLILLLSTIPLGLVFAQHNETEPRASIWVSFGALFGALGGSQLATGGLCTPNLLMFIHGIVLLVLGMTRLTQKPSAPKSPAPNANAGGLS